MAKLPGHMRTGPTPERIRSNLAISSLTEIEKTAWELKELREGYLAEENAERFLPRPFILASWQRCQAFQVDPERRQAPLAISREAQLADLREASEIVLRAARPVMLTLHDFLTDSGYVIVLSDAHGYILDIMGAPEVRRRLARIDFVPGGDWSERGAGTNALGTAIADGHVVQLLGAEHFCAGWQDLTCTAAPIRHPITREVVGILDVTGHYRLIRPFLSGVLATMALDIEEGMRALIAPAHGREGREVAPVHRAPRLTGDQLIEQSHTHSPSPAEAVAWARERIGEPPPEMELSPRHEADMVATAIGAISASLDTSLTLDQIAEQATRLLHLECAAVALFTEREDAPQLSFWPRRSLIREATAQAIEACSQLPEVYTLIRERGEPVLVPDTSALGEAQTLARQGAIGSLALLPLTAARGVLGFLVAPRTARGPWKGSELRLGLSLATHAATALENARLFASLQRHSHRTEVINELAQFLDTLPDPQQDLPQVLRKIMTCLGVEVGVIFEATTEGLTPVAAHGLTVAAHHDLDAGVAHLPHDGACLLTARDGLLLMDRRERDDAFPCELVRAMDAPVVMATPLARDDTAPELILAVARQQSFHKEDMPLFTTIGQQVGLSLRNARLRRKASDIEALREADRLKDSFIAAVSHDLRSPLTAIRTSVESLLDERSAQSVQTRGRLLHNIAGQTSRLEHLVDQLLDLSSIAAGGLSLDREWIDVPTLLADTLVKFEGLHHGCHVERDTPADLPLLYADPDRFVQVVWNLVENASKYAPAGLPIKVNACWKGGHIEVCIADHGPGIPPRDRERVFQRFYRLSRDRRSPTKGSGLGLAICQGIMLAHSGTIQVTERPGGGSVFTCAFPCTGEGPLGYDLAELTAGVPEQGRSPA